VCFCRIPFIQATVPNPPDVLITQTITKRKYLKGIWKWCYSAATSLWNQWGILCLTTPCQYSRPCPNRMSYIQWAKFQTGMELASVLYKHVCAYPHMYTNCVLQIHVDASYYQDVQTSELCFPMHGITWKKWCMIGKWPWYELLQQVLAILSMWPSSSQSYRLSSRTKQTVNQQWLSATMNIHRKINS
jgi:hypothetical protein